MGMSGMYGPADRAESIATIHAALDAGINLLDTGDFYGMGHNEMLIGEALAGPAARATAVLSVKFGALRGPGRRAGSATTRGPPAVKNFARLHAAAGSASTTSTSTARRASTPTCRSRRPSARSPSWSRPATCATSACPRWAPRRSAAPHAVHPIADLQIEYSLISRGHRGRDPARPAASSGIGDHRLRRALARAAQRALVAPTASWPPATSAPTRRASRARTSSATSPWSRRCARSPTATGVTVAQLAIAWVLAQRRGHRAAGRRAHAASASPRRSARSTLELDADDLAAHRARGARRTPPPATATRRRRWRCSTASAADGRGGAAGGYPRRPWRSRYATWPRACGCGDSPTRTGSRATTGSPRSRRSPCGRAASASCSTRSRRRPSAAEAWERIEALAPTRS